LLVMAMVIYVGDSRDVIRRIKTYHLGGNVEASALRRHVAVALGFGLTRTKRPSGATRVRIDLPNPSEGEAAVSRYLKAGQWQYVMCDSYEGANALQWYAIARLAPVLNRDRRAWEPGMEGILEALMRELSVSRMRNARELAGLPSGSGVYVLHHERAPSAHNQPIEPDAKRTRGSSAKR
jgi:hypothetical protein